MHDAASYDPLNPEPTRKALPNEGGFRCTVTEASVDFLTTQASSLGNWVFEYRASFIDHPHWQSASNFVTITVVEPPKIEAANYPPFFESYDNWVSP